LNAVIEIHYNVITPPKVIFYINLLASWVVTRLFPDYNCDVFTFLF